MTSQLLTAAALETFIQQIVNHHGCDGELALYFSITDGENSSCNSTALCTIVRRTLKLNAYAENKYSTGCTFKGAPKLFLEKAYALNIVTQEYAEEEDWHISSVPTTIIARIWGSDKEFHWT